eukprot:UN27352
MGQLPYENTNLNVCITYFAGIGAANIFRATDLYSPTLDIIETTYDRCEEAELSFFNFWSTVVKNMTRIIRDDGKCCRRGTIEIIGTLKKTLLIKKKTQNDLKNEDPTQLWNGNKNSEKLCLNKNSDKNNKLCLNKLVIHTEKKSHENQIITKSKDDDKINNKTQLAITNNEENNNNENNNNNYNNE